MLGRLNRCVTKQELNLFKFSPSQVAQSRAGAAQVMWSEILDISTFRSRPNNVPDGFRCEACAPYPSYSAHSPEECTCAYLGCLDPLINGALCPYPHWYCADVVSFNSREEDHPVLLEDLKIFQ